MALTEHRINALAEALYHCLRRGETMPPLTEREPELTLEDAYYISKAMLALRLAGNGETLIGKKIGVTSDAVQQMLGVFQPDFGFLTDCMAFPNGAAIALGGQLIQPRAEGEIAFRLRADLNGPGVTEDQVLTATECILPCMEIVDSRIHNWQIKIEDTVADNASCGVYVLGDTPIDPRGLDLSQLELELYKNDAFVSSGKGTAVQGNPLTAVAWLANTLAEFDIALLAGETILSGSFVPLEPVAAGDRLVMKLKGYDDISCSFTA